VIVYTLIKIKQLAKKQKDQDSNLQDQDQDFEFQDQDQDHDSDVQDRDQDQDFEKRVSRPRLKSREPQLCICSRVDSGYPKIRALPTVPFLPNF